MSNLIIFGNHVLSSHGRGGRARGRSARVRAPVWSGVGDGRGRGRADHRKLFLYISAVG